MNLRMGRSDLAANPVSEGLILQPGALHGLERIRLSYLGKSSAVSRRPGDSGLSFLDNIDGLARTKVR